LQALEIPVTDPQLFKMRYRVLEILGAGAPVPRGIRENVRDIVQGEPTGIERAGMVDHEAERP
jgi:hypothetical protein